MPRRLKMKFLALVIVSLIVVSGMAFATVDTSPCPDGTAYGKCSTANPGNWCTGAPGSHALMQYVTLCPCTVVAGWVQSVDGDAATCVQALCDDGTKNGECAKAKPKVCVGGSAYADNATKCGCPAGKRVASGEVFCEFIPCSYNGETVNEGLCSVKKGKMCANGTMVDAATKCGCQGGTSKVGEKCATLCTDGTVEGSCAPTKPRRCVSGNLVDDAQTCGCPEGQSKVGSNCASGVLGAIGSGADLLTGGSGGNQNQSGGNANGTAGSGSSPLSCCCLPTALIGIVGGFAVFRKKE